MASIIPGWSEFKTYVEKVGPELGRPDRPCVCPFCDGVVIWFNGWRQVFSVVLIDEKPHRFDDGLWLQRVVCATCHKSWTLRPPFLYPQRSLEPDVAEAAALAYLSNPTATYEKTAKDHNCSARSVWRWVGWIAGSLSIGELLAEAEQSCGAGQVAALIPREVSQDHAKAYSPEREKVLLDAFQGLSALSIRTRALPVPPTDPSPLRFWLTERFQTFRQVHRLVEPIVSPPMPEDCTGPP